MRSRTAGHGPGCGVVPNGRDSKAELENDSDSDEPVETRESLGEVYARYILS
jgi:hypothetical protein